MAKRERSALGLVVNPKLAVPLLVLGDEDALISIQRMNAEAWPTVGQGYYGEEDDEASRVTNMPRSHTPDGVRIRKQGYGTALYTALCLGAHQNSEGRYRLGYVPDGDGICSQEGTRSAEAEEWWHGARRLGLARVETSEETEEHFDATDELSSAIRGETIGDSTVTYVNTIDVDIEKRIQADAYAWHRAASHNLVATDFTIPLPGDMSPEALWRIIHESGDELELFVETPWILALDVRGLTIDAINLLGVIAQVSGATERELDHLRLRWEMNLDPSAEIRQELLPFKRNSSEARAVGQAMAETAELRERAGWAPLAELP